MKGRVRAMWPTWARTRKFAAFALIPMMGAATPLLSIPAITYKFGSLGWASIAIGMSLGAGLGVLVELGWGLTGPQLAARTGIQDRPRLYLLALVTRAIVLVASCALLFVVPFIPGVSYLGAAIVAAISTAAIGLSPTWYFLGTAQPSLILVVDSLPRVIAVLVSSALLLFGAPLWISPAFSLLVSLCAPLAAWLIVRQIRHDHISFSRQEIWVTIVGQGKALSGRAVSALYIALPTVLVAFVAPGAVAQFAAAERLMRMALTVLQSVPNSLQNWLGAAKDFAQSRERIFAAVIMNAIIGLLAATVYSLLAPWISHVLFTGTITLPTSLAIVGGGVILVSSTSRATGGLGLVNLGRVGWIALSAVAGAVVGVTLILVLGGLWGAIGAALGELSAEVAVLGVQTAVLLGVIRKLGRIGASGNATTESAGVKLSS